MSPTSGVSLMHALVLLFAARVSAYWIMTCPQRNMIGRADPLMAPGKISSHVHTISGGNAFGFDMNYKQARTATCSSCPIKEDLSSYWTPVLYYRKNGKFKLVKQDGIGDGSSGMNVYYVQNHGGDKSQKINAFPKGFRMIAGNPFKRNFTGDFAAEAINFSCLDYSKQPSAYVNKIPNKKCANGVRAQVFFPTCWKGPDAVDSPNHKDHVAYPTSGRYDDGPCPASHPHRLPSLFFEVTYRTQDYDDEWEEGGPHPFVFAYGDPTGYGFHGDFVNGWDVPTLQKAIDTCTNPNGDLASCKPFTFFSTEFSKTCTIPNPIKENIEGPFDALPGCNPVQEGPEMAVKHDCPADASVKVTSSMHGPIKKPQGKIPGGSATWAGYGKFTGGGGSAGSAGTGGGTSDTTDNGGSAGSGDSGSGSTTPVKAASNPGVQSLNAKNKKALKLMQAKNDQKLAEMNKENAAKMQQMKSANEAAGSYAKMHRHRRRHQVGAME